MTDRATWWLRIAERFGVPVALLMFLVLSLWSAGTWTAVNIAKPLVERHIKFIDAAELSARASADAAQRNADSVRDLSGGINAMAGGQVKQVEILQQLCKEQVATRDANAAVLAEIQKQTKALREIAEQSSQ